MKTIWRIFYESLSQATQQLLGNKLRSFLSLLGITIGIFCIIGVFSAVDSLENNIRSSFDKLGQDVVYLSKFSWTEDPGSNYFKYLRRPAVTHKDFQILRERVHLADKIAFYTGIGRRVAKFRATSVERAYLFAITEDFGDVFNLEMERGRYFSPSEMKFGSNKVVLGSEVAEALFGSLDPVGKTVKISGRNLEVIGVLEKSGESIVNVMNFDPVLMISYELGRKMANLTNRNQMFDNTSVAIKAGAGVSTAFLKDEVTGILRAQRQLKPSQENDFSLNELSILSGILDGFFNVLNILGIFIGGFATLVGMFSVANIMFVSVKERTRIIGIKKALGAKSAYILLEFLIESIALCILGGVAGLVLILGVLAILTAQFDSFEFVLSMHNVILGIALSVVIGVLAGMIPALQAARMDPVEAMRH
ncbi:MAG: ABC transporter permease [Haliscomenobacter sp.]